MEEGHSRASLSMVGYWGSGSQSTHEPHMGGWVLTKEFSFYSDLSLFQEDPLSASLSRTTAIRQILPS